VSLVDIGTLGVLFACARVYKGTTWVHHWSPYVNP